MPIRITPPSSLSRAVPRATLLSRRSDSLEAALRQHQTTRLTGPTPQPALIQDDERSHGTGAFIVSGLPRMMLKDSMRSCVDRRQYAASVRSLPHLRLQTHLAASV